MSYAPTDKEGKLQRQIAALLDDLKRLEARQAADHAEADAIAQELHAIMNSLMDLRRELAETQSDEVARVLDAKTKQSKEEAAG